MSPRQIHTNTHTYTCTLRNDMETWLSNFFPSNLYLWEAFLLLKSETASTFKCHLNKISSWCTAGGPFHLCDSHSTECYWAGDPGISESRELVQSPAFRSHLSHLLISWNSKFSVKASANDDKESSQEKQLSFNVSKIVRNVKHIKKSKCVPPKSLQ